MLQTDDWLVDPLHFVADLMRTTVRSRFIVSLSFLFQVITSEGAAVKRLKASTEIRPNAGPESSLWFDINSPDGDGVAPIKSHVSTLRDAESRIVSLSSNTLPDQQISTLNKKAPKLFSSPIQRVPKPPSTLNQRSPKVSPPLSQGAPKLPSSLGSELDIQSLLLLQVQGQKLDNILENLETLSNKLPEMTSCECDCVVGSGDDLTELPVTLQHLKSNIERLKKDGTSDKEIVIAVFTAMYSGLEVRRLKPNCVIRF